MHHHQIMPTAAALHHHPSRHGQHLTDGALLAIRQGVCENDFPLRILVQSDMVGAIIGRSGSTIKQITQESKARIDVHREDSLDQNEKVITINGSPESCSSACFKIIEIVMNESALLKDKNNYNNNNSSNNLDYHDDINRFNNNNEGENNLKSQEEEEEVEENNEQSTANDQCSEIQLRILAHNNVIGRLIGRSGASIRKIMEQTSTTIYISGNGNRISKTIDTRSSTNERTITVVGELEQVRQAEKIISSKLRAAYMSDINTQLQAISQQPYLFNHVQIPYIPGPYAPNSIISTLVDSQIGRMHALSRTGPQSLTTNHSPSSYLSLYPNIGVPPTGHPLLGFNPTNMLEETVHIYIPSSMVGAIIGKAGSAIKEMMICSGASIKVIAAPTTTNNNNNASTTNNTTTTTTPTSSEPTSNVNESRATTTTTVAEEKKEGGGAKSEQEDQSKPSTNSANSKDQTTPNAKSSSNADGTSINNNNNSPMQDSQTTASNSTSPQQTTRHQHNGNNNNNNSSESYPSTRKVTIIGNPESQWSAQFLIYRKVTIESGKSDISLMVEIQVPSQLVGKIIGKAGATVKDIQKQTRTTIRLPYEKQNVSEVENDVAISETSVQITGEFRGTQLAQRHIRSLIKERF